jgi:PadR family transcriptional regulator, regulatory protein PadR
MKAEAQVLKGHLDMLLLATLENGPRHGYAVREALREASQTRFDLPTGTIYPALRRLETAGLLKGRWSAESGRRRRTYELTAAGRRRLAGDRAAWHDFTSVVSAILEPASCPATP